MWVNMPYMDPMGNVTNVCRHPAALLNTVAKYEAIVCCCEPENQKSIFFHFQDSFRRKITSLTRLSKKQSLGLQRLLTWGRSLPAKLELANGEPTLIINSLL